MSIHCRCHCIIPFITECQTWQWHQTDRTLPKTFHVIQSSCVTTYVIRHSNEEASTICVILQKMHILCRLSKINVRCWFYKGARITCVGLYICMFPSTHPHWELCCCAWHDLLCKYLPSVITYEHYLTCIARILNNNPWELCWGTQENTSAIVNLAVNCTIFLVC